MQKTITHLFTRDIIIQRLKTTTGYKKTFQSTATVEGRIQELSREAIQRLGIIESRAFEGWFDYDEDVREGDRIIDRHGTVFLAKTVTLKDYGINTHVQVILEKTNE